MDNPYMLNFFAGKVTEDGPKEGSQVRHSVLSTNLCRLTHTKSSLVLRAMPGLGHGVADVLCV